MKILFLSFTCEILNRLPLPWLHNNLKLNLDVRCVIETSTDLPRISLVIFLEIFRIFFGKSSKTFDWPSDNFWRIFGNLQKVFGNLQKIVKKASLVCLYNKQNITCPLVDTNFIFSCFTRHMIYSMSEI